MPNSAFGKSPASGAKQFMPFAALKGYEDLVRKQEREPVKRHELTEDEVERISIELAALSKGDLVRVVHYRSGNYLTDEGIVNKIVPEFQHLTIGCMKISFKDILEIERI